MGFTHVWLMGVWSTGPEARRVALSQRPLQQWVVSNFGPDVPFEKVIGASPYAISGYSVSEQLGGEAGLARFRRALNSAGMKLLLDFIPNHTGIDHPWVSGRPELFVHAPSDSPGSFRVPGNEKWLAHGKDPYFPPWMDTAQLDYRVSETQAAMLGELQKVAASCDGVRCDMAMLVTREIFERTWRDLSAPSPAANCEFWPEAVRSVKKRFPEFIFLAEVYWGLERRLQEMGFDYTYDKALSDHLIAGEGREVRTHLCSQGRETVARSAHFLENHDEPRVAGRLPLDRHRAAAMIVLALPGMRFIHEGQFDGCKIHTPVQALIRPSEPGDSSVRKLYEDAFDALKTSGFDSSRAEPGGAVCEGVGAEHVVAIAASGEGSACGSTVYINLCNVPARARVAEAGAAGVDLCGHTAGVALSGGPGAGVFLELPAWSWAIARLR